MLDNFQPKNISNYDDNILKEKTQKFDFLNPPIEPIELAHILSQNMIHYKCLGLSANQIGLPYRVFVLTGKPIICCFNPVIVDSSTENIYLDEVSLTYPEYSVKIKRPSIIKVRYAEPNGNIVTKKLIGMTARLFQQQLDWLDGINFISKASLYHKEKSKKKMRKK